MTYAAYAAYTPNMQTAYVRPAYVIRRICAAYTKGTQLLATTGYILVNAQRDNQNHKTLDKKNDGLQHFTESRTRASDP